MTTTLPTLHLVVEAQMPQAHRDRAAGVSGRRRQLVLLGDVARLAGVTLATFGVVFVYLGIPIALFAGDRLDSLLHALVFAGAVVIAGTATILALLHSTNLDLEADDPSPTLAARTGYQR